MIVALTLVAALCLGIGYAAVTTTLEITGTAEMNIEKLNEALDAKVYFTKVSTGSTLADDASAAYTDNVTGNTASIVSTNNDKGTFTLKNLVAEGDSASITYEIKNESTSDVSLAATIADGYNINGAAFTPSYSFANATLAAGATTTVTVTVRVDTLPEATSDATFNFGITATVVNP